MEGGGGGYGGEIGGGGSYGGGEGDIEIDSMII
jgi:hypothetical protein